MKKIIFTLSIFIFISCASVDQKKDNGFADTFLNNELKNYVMSAAISSDQEGTTTNFNARLMVAERDSLALTAFGPFGVTVAKMYSDRERFVFYNIFENFALEGEPVKESFKEAVNIEFSFNDVIKILRAEVPDDPSGFEQIENLTSEAGVLYRYTGKDFVAYVVADSKTNQLLQYQRKDLNGKMISNIFYRDYKIVSGLSFPHRIVFRFPEASTEVTFNVKDIKINETINESFRFNVPSNVKKTKIG